MIYDFFLIFQKTWILKNSKRFEILKLVVGYCKDTLRSFMLQVLRSNATALMLSISEM